MIQVLTQSLSYQGLAEDNVDHQLRELGYRFLGSLFDSLFQIVNQQQQGGLVLFPVL